MMVSMRVWYVSTIYIRAEGLDATSNGRAPSQFAATGYRQYDKDAVRLVHFIKHAQELGFTLRDISELIALRKKPKNCARAGALALAKVEEIDRRVRRLTSIRKTLAELATACRNGDADHECPIIEALTDGHD